MLIPVRVSSEAEGALKLGECELAGPHLILAASLLLTHVTWAQEDTDSSPNLTDREDTIKDLP